MTTLLRVLASLRGLRGTPFDIFRFSHDRRTERELIAEFEDAVDRLSSELSIDNARKMRDIITSYMDIRGYGPVKDAAIAQVRRRIESI